MWRDREERDLYTVYKYICKLYSSFVQALALLFVYSLPLPAMGVEALATRPSFLEPRAESPCPLHSVWKLTLCAHGWGPCDDMADTPSPLWWEEGIAPRHSCQGW